MIGKFGYKFQNLLGSTYNGGDILFTPDSSTLIVPVGNRITCFDLLNNTTITLPIEIRYNIVMLSLSDDGKILVAIDENGGIYFINYHMRVLFSRYNGLKGNATAFKFSPDSKLWAVAIGEKLKIFKTPSIVKEFNAIQKISDTAIGLDVIDGIAWNPQSNVVATSSSDGNIRLYPIIHLRGVYEPIILSCGNKVVDFFFSSWKRIIVVTKKAIMTWQWKKAGEKKVEEKKLYHKLTDRRKRTKILDGKKGRWISFKKEQIKMDTPGVIIVGASPNLALDMIALSYSNGACKIVQLSSLQVMHELGQVHDQKKVESIEDYLTNDISSISLNNKGNWLAISHKIGSVVVWEWETKTFILKQQGHLSNVNAVAYSPDSSMVVSGGVDGKVKVWNTKTGHCFITFSDHTAAVNQVAFSPKGNAVFSASLDGTVRAYDLVRFRNFRILTTPKPTQFSCLGVDNAGEIICAGSNDNFGIFVWSLQTGKLLEILTGHIAPVSSVVFSPTDTLMVSGSWDKSTRVWDVFTGKGKVEILEHTSDVLSIAFKPDGKEICTANLRGVLTFWDPKEKELKGSIETLCDSWGGRVSNDIRSAKSRSFGRIFNSVSYSPNGNSVIACGNSIYVCIYNVEQKSLIRKFQITHNLSLDGVLDKLTSLNMTESGNKNQIDHDEEYENEKKLSFHDLRLKKNEKDLKKIPGVLNGVHSTGLIHKKKVLARSFQVSFSSTGRSWMCATSEGILLYSMDDSLMFDPYQLDISVTPQNLLLVLSKKQYMDAMIMGLKLNVFEIIRHVFYNIPVIEIEYISQNFPFSYLDKLFTFLGQELESPQHIEVLLKWSTQLLQSHGKFLKENYLRYLPFFRVLHKNINSLKKDLSKVCDENTYNLSFLSHTHTLPVMTNSDLVSKEDVSSSKSNSVVVHLDVLPPKRFNKRKTSENNKDKK